MFACARILAIFAASGFPAFVERKYCMRNVSGLHRADSSRLTLVVSSNGVFGQRVLHFDTCRIHRGRVGVRLGTEIPY